MELGQLQLTLSADGAPIQNALRQVRSEAADTASAISGMFLGAFPATAAVTFSQAFFVGIANDIERLNTGLSTTELLLGNLEKGFQAVGQIGILELGNIAAFLKEDLFEGPLAGIQQGMLEQVGLGQLNSLYGLASGADNAVKLALPALQGITLGIQGIDDALANIQGKANAASTFFIGIANNADLVKDVLTSLAKLIDDGIEKAIARIKSLHPALATAGDLLQSLGADFRLGTSVLGEYVESAEKVEKAATGMSQAFGHVQSAAGTARSGLGLGQSALNEFGKTADKSKSALEKFRAGLKDIADAGTLFSSWQTASDIFDQFFGDLEQNFNAAKAAENLANRLDVTSSSARGVSEDLEFLRKVSNDLGTDFNASAEGFAQLSAAAQLTNLKGEKTKQIFQDVAQASAVMRLSAAETEGVFLALRQSLSGGTIQLEELNQLSERLPGAFQAASQALGVTTGELRGLISTGAVASEDFIPKFTAQLAANTQTGVVGASQSAEASVNRFNNSLQSLQVEMGKAWVEVGTPALNMFSGALDVATANEELFSTTLDALLIASIFKAIPALINFAGGFDVIKDKVFANTGVLKSYAIQVAVAYAAIETFYRIMDRVKNGAEGFDTSIKSIELSLESLTSTASKTGQTIKDVLPQEPAPTDWLDALVRKWNDLPFLSKNLDEKFGLNKLLDIPTNAQKRLDDIRIAIADLGEVSGKTADAARQLREQFKFGQGPLAELKAIDSQLKSLEAQKLSINPENEGAIKKLAEDEKQLLQQRVEAQKQVQATQAALNNAITQTEQRLKAIDPANVGVKAAQELSGQLQIQLNVLTKEKTAFDELANTATNTAQVISNDFAKATSDLEQNFVSARAAIIQAQAEGRLSEEQANQQSLEAEKNYLSEKLRLNQENLEKIRAELNRDVVTKKIDSTAGLSTDQQKKLAEEVKQLEQETAQTRIELAQQVVREKKAAEEEMLEALRRANSEAEAVIQRTETDRIAAIKRQQLAGQIGEEQATQKIEQIKTDSLNAELAQIKKQISEVAKLRASGSLSVEEAKAKELELNQKLSDANLQFLDRELKQREEVKRKAEQLAEEEKRKAEEYARKQEQLAEEARRRAEEAKRQQLEQIEEVNKRAESAIRQSTDQQIIAVKRLQLARQISEEEGQKHIEQIQANATQKEIAATQQKLAQVNQLKMSGLLTQKEATEQQLQLEEQLGQLNLQQIDRQLQAQKLLEEEQKRSQEERLRNIEQETEARRNQIELDQQANDIIANARKSQLDLLNAQLNLAGALGSLEEQRLEIKLAEASSDAEKFQIEQQLSAIKLNNLNESQAIQRQIFELSQSQNAIEANRAVLMAQIAELEAQAALEKAKAAKASQAELDSLEKALSLRQQISSQMQQAYEQQGKLRDMERQALQANQQREKERLEADIRAKEKKTKEVTSSTAGGAGGSSTSKPTSSYSLVVGSAQWEQERRARSQFEQTLQKPGDQQLNLLHSATSMRENPFFSLMLQQNGMGNINELANQFRDMNPIKAASVEMRSAISGKDAIEELKKLNEGIQSLAARPSTLQVNAVNPVKDAGRIYSNLSRNAARGAGL
ncbi:MAG: tape measure protein [Kastovskya adunca ATA6-11-RM4]|jgi:tape measure domain-containing protein|nr:tape measure protein [Kastovskya adunca ATA6-11-RM4]